MTNLIPLAATTPTMSSREIAELVESRHDTVKLTIERLRDKGLIAFTPTAEKSTGGRPGVSYHVGKRDSYVIVAQLCPEFTARLVDRWQELKPLRAAFHDIKYPTAKERTIFPDGQAYPTMPQVRARRTESHDVKRPGAKEKATCP